MSRIVLGGGLAGLSAAKYLANQFPSDRVRILEASNRTGGWIKSTQLDSDVIFEQGPRTIRPKGVAGANTLDLVEDLQLAEEVVPIKSTHPAASNRMIYVNKKLHPVPTSLKSLFVTKPPFSKPLISYLINDVVHYHKKRGSKTDESIYDFTHRRFGREIADYLISPMICGICAGNAKEISVKFLMERLFEYEQKHGGVIRGFINSFLLGNENESETVVANSNLSKRARKEKWSIYSFKNGMETLTQALTRDLLTWGVKIDLNSSIKSLTLKPHHVQIETKYEKFDAKHVISSLPSQILSTLVEKEHPYLAEYLRRIPRVSVAVVNLKYNENHIKDKAFGFLTSPIEKLPILGVVYDSCCFPNRKHNTVLTVMMGGYWFKKYFGSNPDEEYIFSIATKHVEEILGITEYPTEYKVNILHNCIPQYVIGHQDNIKRIEEYLKNYKLPLSICGASYYGVGVNDVILGAKKAVQEIA